MKGVVFPSQGAEPIVSTDLEKPKPSADQLLVRSIYAAINPVDAFMNQTGFLLADSFPLGLGVDGAGIVTEVGNNAKAKFAVGDEVCGCTRLGSHGFATAAEYFLLDAEVAIPKPKNITLQQAATLGVGAETACLGLFYNMPLPSLDSTPDEAEDWFIILGGASSVGKYAVQLAVAAGYRVAASCSAKTADLVRELGATPFDYKKSQENQIEDVLSITGREGFTRIFDAVATNTNFSMELFKAAEKGKTKYFSTTNDWDDIPEKDDVKVHKVELGQVGRPGGKELNAKIASFIPVIVGLVEQDKMMPSPYDIVGGVGAEAGVEAYKYQQSGAGGANKVLAKVQDE